VDENKVMQIVYDAVDDIMIIRGSGYDSGGFYN